MLVRVASLFFVPLLVVFVNSNPIILERVKSQESGVSSLNCILQFYRKQTRSQEIYPGSLIKFNLFFGVHSEFQNAFLRRLADLRNNYYNTTFVIEMADDERIEPFRIMPKVSKYIMLVSQKMVAVNLQCFT